MQLLLDTHGLVIKKRNSSFWVQAKTTSRLISPHRVTSIAVTSNCFLSTSAIRLAVAHQIPIYLMDGIGQFRYSSTGQTGHTDPTITQHVDVMLRDQQINLKTKEV